MRLYMLALAVCVLNLTPLVRADEESFTKPPATSMPIKIETRFVTVRSDFAEVCKQFDWGKIGLVPTAPEVESLFTAEPVDSDGSETIKLISASTVVAERNPIFVETLPQQRMMEFTQLVQRDTRSLIMFAPEVTVSDRDTAEIIDTRKRPYVVDHQNGQAVVREYEEGTTLLVRPCVNQSGSLKLDLQARFDQIEDVNTIQKSEKCQVQSPRTKTTKIELSARLKPGETLVVWGNDMNSPEVTATPTGFAKIMRKKPAFKAPHPTLVLLITPKVLSEEVASTLGK